MNSRSHNLLSLDLLPTVKHNVLYVLQWGTHMELVPMAEFTIVTRSSSSAWIPELIAAAGPEVTETYIDFFTSTIRNRNTRAAYARACWQFFDWCAAHGPRAHDRAAVPCDRLD